MQRHLGRAGQPEPEPFSALGYDPKETRNGRPLCASCHKLKKNVSFYKLHDKHVKDKKIACAERHTFTR